MDTSMQPILNKTIDSKSANDELQRLFDYYTYFFSHFIVEDPEDCKFIHGTVETIDKTYHIQRSIKYEFQSFSPSSERLKASGMKFKEEPRRYGTITHFKKGKKRPWFSSWVLQVCTLFTV